MDYVEVRVRSSQVPDITRSVRLDTSFLWPEIKNALIHDLDVDVNEDIYFVLLDNDGKVAGPTIMDDKRFWSLYDKKYIDDSQMVFEMNFRHRVERPNVAAVSTKPPMEDSHSHQRVALATDVHIASLHGNLAAVRKLVENGAHLGSRDDTSSTPLHYACAKGHFPLVMYLLTEKSLVKNYRDNRGRTPLLCAASAGHLEVVKYLIAEKVFTFVVDQDGNSALHLAAMHGHVAVVNWLTESGDVDTDARNVVGQLYNDLLPTSSVPEMGSTTAISSLGSFPSLEAKTGRICPKEEVLHAHMPTSISRPHSYYTSTHPSRQNAHSSAEEVSTERGGPELTSYRYRRHSGTASSVSTVDQQSTVELRFKAQHTEALLSACYSGDFEVAQQFLTTADPNGIHTSSLSALHLTCHLGHAAFAESLLRAGASTKLRDRRGFTALHLACQARHMDVVEVLFSYNAQLVPDDQGLTPLHYAAISGEAELVKLLVAHGGNINDIDNTGNSAYHYIMESKNTVLALWVAENYDVDMFALNINGITPLDIARNAGLVELSTALLDLAATNKKNRKRATAGKLLLEACAQRKWGEANDILSDEVDLSISNPAGQHAIHLCALGGSLRCIEKLLRLGVSIDLVDATESRLTPLLCATKEKHADLVAFLVEKNADVNAEDSSGFTPLFYACLNADIDCAGVLLRNGADPLHRDWKKNDTVMHVACRNCNVDMVKWLENTIEGMSVNSQFKNKSQQTPLDVALMVDCVDVIIYAKESWDLSRRKNSVLFTDALADKDMDRAAQIIQIGIDPNHFLPNSGDVVFHVACEKGNIHMVKAMLEQGASLSLEGRDGKTAIHCACGCGQLEVIRWLKKCGCSLNDRSGTGMTPLHYACLSGDAEVVRWLIDRGANASYTSKDLSSALHFACASGNKTLVKLFVVEFGQSPVALNHNGERPIDMAANAGQVELVVWLAREMDLPADDSAELRKAAEEAFKIEMDHFHSKRLRNAACTGNLNEIKDALDHGIDVDNPSDDGMTALHLACANRCVDAVQYLLRRGGSVNCKTATGYTPLHVACRKGFQDVFDILVEGGADVMSFDADGSNILSLACQSPNVQLAQFIVRTYPQFNECRKNKRGVSPLHMAAVAGNLELVLWLSSNLWITRHQQFLFDACERGDHKAAQSFISLGLDVNILNDDGMSPLHMACYLSGTALVQKLLSAGAKPRIADMSFRVPLHIAAAKGYAEIVKLLCDADSEVDIVDDLGMTPLLYACKNGHMLTAAYLVGHRADVLKTDNGQNTALHYACRSGDLPLVQWLYEGYSLSADIRNVERKSAADIARLEGSSTIVTFFEQKRRQRAEEEQRKREAEELAAARRRHEEIEREKAMIEERARAQAQNQEYVQKLKEEEAVKRRAQKMLANATSTHLIEMALAGNLHDVVELLAYNTDPDSRSEKENATALHMACRGGHCAIIEALLNSGATCDVLTIGKETPLLIACQGSNWDCAMYLLAHGADPTICNVQDICALDIICDSGICDLFQETLRTIRESPWGHKFNPNITDSKGFSMLHRLVLSGRTDMVKSLLQYDADINCKTTAGKTPLLMACETANFQVATALIHAGANLSLTDENGTTCLLAAVKGGSRELVHVLLKDSGVRLHDSDIEGNTALHHACALGLDEIGRLLLDSGASFFVENAAGDSPPKLAEKSKCFKLSKYMKKSQESIAEIIEVCSTGDVEWLRVMLSRGVDILRTDAKQVSGLHVAAHQGRTEIVALFIENGADVNLDDSDGRTPLHYACFGGKIDVIKILVEANADLMRRSRVGRSCAHYASQSGSVDVVKWISLDGRLDINCTSLDKSTPLHDAASSNNVQVVSHLVRAGASVHALTITGANVFHVACLSNALDVAKWLLDNCDFDIDAVDSVGQSSFLMACGEGHVETAQWLYYSGANFLCTGGAVDSWDTSLHVAARAGHRVICEWLLERGMNAFAINSKDETAVDAAAQSGHDDLAEWMDVFGQKLLTSRVCDLVAHELDKALEGVNIVLALALLEDMSAAYFDHNDHMGVRGEYMLQRAAGVGAMETVKLLVAEGVDVNAPTSGSKMTPLHYACLRGHDAVVTFLLKRGASVSAKDRKGLTPLDIARKEQYDDIVSIMEPYEIASSRGLTLPVTSAQDPGEKKVDEALLVSSSHSTRSRDSTSSSDSAKLKLGEIKTKSEEEQLTLHRVVSVGRLDLVTSFVEQFAVDVDEIDPPTGRTALHFACAQNFEEIAQYLMLRGAGLNRIDSVGDTPLHIACRRKNRSLAIEMVRNKADLTIPDGDGNTSLHIICRNGMQELLEDIIDLPRSILRNLNLDVVDSDGKNLLHLSVECQALDMASLFIRQGVHINCADHKKMTALHYAVLLNQFDIAQSLLIRKADVNARDIYNRTPLSLAVLITKDVNFGRILREFGADMSFEDEAKNTFLHIACRDGSVELAKWLTRCGADPNTANASGQSAVQLAHQNGHEDLMEWLLAWILSVTVGRPVEEILAEATGDASLRNDYSNAQPAHDHGTTESTSGSDSNGFSLQAKNKFDVEDELNDTTSAYSELGADSLHGIHSSLSTRSRGGASMAGDGKLASKRHIALL